MITAQAPMTRFMRDRCMIQYASVVDGDEPTTVYTSGAEIKCLVGSVVSGKGNSGGNGNEASQHDSVAIGDASLLLPIGTVISSIDRVLITSRYGHSAYVDQTFAVVGEPSRTPATLTVTLRLVPGESRM